MLERYSRNIPSVSEAEQEALARKRVLVAGCGGLGGCLIEYLARMGVGEITAVDGDVFEPSNLNRQLLSQEFLDAHNADGLVRGQDLVLDALDNAGARLILEDACACQGVTIVHGAIQGWFAQAAVAPPGAGVLHRLYASPAAPVEKTSLPFTPAFCAAIQAAEAVKLLCGRPSALEGKLLLADLRRMDWDLLPL